jgi:transcriptional regulator with XRE-family HTH domain
VSVFISESIDLVVKGAHVPVRLPGLKHATAGKKGLPSINAKNTHERSTTQAQYLSELLKLRQLSARDVARQSKALAEQFQDPQLMCGHQAVSSWVNGTRVPTFKSRRALARVLEVPLQELTLVCENKSEEMDCFSASKLHTLCVNGRDRVFEYKVTFREAIDLSLPAVYHNWNDMFALWPASLVRHFRSVKYSQFGWIPDRSSSPVVPRAQSLVPLRSYSAAIDGDSSCEMRVWFVYLPGGVLRSRIGCMNGRSLSLLKNNGTGFSMETYSLGRVEVVGYVAGRTLFHLSSVSGSTGLIQPLLSIAKQ